MNIHFRLCAPADRPTVSEFILQLYREDLDPTSQPMTQAKIERTFDWLDAHPGAGTVMVFEQDAKLVGYAILINFWSNEYSGNALTIDELFVAPAFRSKGIATEFIEYLAREHYADAVEIQLEVAPRNTRARALYERLGFRSEAQAGQGSENQRMIKELLG